MSDAKLHPFPGALRGRPWRVRNTPGRGGIHHDRRSGQHVMEVDLSDSPLGEHVRRHEMLHAGFSHLDRPQPGRPVEGQLLQNIEDLRVEEIGEAIGFDWSEYDETIHELFAGIEERLDSFEAHHLVGLALSSRPYPKTSAMVKKLADAKLAESEIDAEPVWEAAEEIVAEIEANPNDPDLPYEVVKRLAHFFPDTESCEHIAMRQLIQEAREPGDDTLEDETHWGDLYHYRHALRKPWTSKISNAGARPTDMGAVPRNFHRLPIDQRVFDARRRMGLKATVLVDRSGSMSLTRKQIQAVLDRAPGAHIAGYSAPFPGEEGAVPPPYRELAARKPLEVGFLETLAEGGRCVERVPSSGNGNVVDGPALDWLARQRGARIWVSDGGVTGKGDAGWPDLQEACLRKVERSRIRHVRTVNEAIELIDELRQGRRL